MTNKKNNNQNQKKEKDKVIYSNQEASSSKTEKVEEIDRMLEESNILNKQLQERFIELGESYTKIWKDDKFVEIHKKKEKIEAEFWKKEKEQMKGGAQKILESVTKCNKETIAILTSKSKDNLVEFLGNKMDIGNNKNANRLFKMNDQERKKEAENYSGLDRVMFDKLAKKTGTIQASTGSLVTRQTTLNVVTWIPIVNMIADTVAHNVLISKLDNAEIELEKRFTVEEVREIMNEVVKYDESTESKLTRVTKYIKKLEEELDRSQKNREEFQEKGTQTEKQSQEKQTQALQGEIQFRDQKIDELNKKLISSHEKIDELEKDNLVWKEKYQKLQQELDKLRNEELKAEVEISPK